MTAVATSGGGEATGGILGSLFGGIVGGGGGVSTAGSFASSGGSLGVFAHGGSFVVPGTGTVERPITFDAHPKERVTVTTPEQEREKSGGGTTINIDARGADQAAVARLERVVLQMNATFNRRAISAVAESRRRG